jgi:hypothetical protein
MLKKKYLEYWFECSASSPNCRARGSQCPRQKCVHRGALIQTTIQSFLTIKLSHCLPHFLEYDENKDDARRASLGVENTCLTLAERCEGVPLIHANRVPPAGGIAVANHPITRLAEVMHRASHCSCRPVEHPAVSQCGSQAAVRGCGHTDMPVNKSVEASKAGHRPWEGDTDAVALVFKSRKWALSSKLVPRSIPKT